MSSADEREVNPQLVFGRSDIDYSDLPPLERILRATYETILENQISGTRLRKIAQNAGIAQGHLHYYFSSKDDLLMELLDCLIESFSGQRQALLNDTSKNALNKLFALLDVKKNTIERGEEDFVLFDYWVQGNNNETIRKNIDSFYRPWREAIEKVVQSGIDSGEFSAKYADMLPSYLISIMDGAALQYLIDDEAFNLDEYFDTAREILSKLLEVEK